MHLVGYLYEDLIGIRRELCYERTSCSDYISRFRTVDYCHLGSDVVYPALTYHRAA